MQHLSRRQWILLVLLTLVWGLNWPVMKFGVTGFPPLTFRALCMWLGLPLLGSFLLLRRVPFGIGREHWPELAMLTVFNMFFWHTLAILATQSLSSGRAAILGYTMPVFSASVSYTHLDVYKRQAPGRGCNRPREDRRTPKLADGTLQAGLWRRQRRGPLHGQAAARPGRGALGRRKPRCYAAG